MTNIISGGNFDKSIIGSEIHGDVHIHHHAPESMLGVESLPAASQSIPAKKKGC